VFDWSDSEVGSVLFVGVLGFEWAGDGFGGIGVGLDGSIGVVIVGIGLQGLG